MASYLKDLMSPKGNKNYKRIRPHENPLIKGSSGFITPFRNILPEMLIAHELFHILKIRGVNTSKFFLNKDPKYFAVAHNTRGNKEEASAVRYTNLIRIDLGLDYIRATYRFNNIVDTVDFSLTRWHNIRNQVKRVLY